MSTNRVAVDCPSCSPADETVHEVLHESGHATVRCTECDHVHKTALPDESTVDRRVIVSQEGDSFEASVGFDPDETLSVDDEFLVETDEAILSVAVTSLEPTGEGSDDEPRTDAAPARDVKTVWTRVVGNVAVDLTLHPKDGRHDSTYATRVQVPGDETFTVGETHAYGDAEFTVEGIVLRDDIERYGQRKLDYAGDQAPAKHIKRVYARDESKVTSAWSGW
ncbi:MAG: HVO_0476 family zinc finger protein [Haloglomus sp.]